MQDFDGVASRRRRPGPVKSAAGTEATGVIPIRRLPQRVRVLLRRSLLSLWPMPLGRRVFLYLLLHGLE